MSFDIIQVSVGEPAVIIPVYKDIICSVAPYFQGACNHNFRDAEDRVISLTDIDEPTFRLFLRWCHSQVRPISNNEGHFTVDDCIVHRFKTPGDFLFDEYNTAIPQHFKNTTSEERNRLYYKNPNWISSYQRISRSLLKLYIFADRYCVDQLRDDVLSALMGYALYWQWWLDPEDIEFINMAYDALPSSSPFLRFIVMPNCYFWQPPESAKDLAQLEALHPRFLLEVIGAKARREEGLYEGSIGQIGSLPNNAEDGLADSCLFHEHLVFNREECRKRLMERPFIFQGLIDVSLEEA